MLTIHKQTVLLHPIIDEFYDDDPSHDRSSVYAVSKGLVNPTPQEQTKVADFLSPRVEKSEDVVAGRSQRSPPEVTVS